MAVSTQHYLNTRIYNDYLDRLLNIAFTLFEWTGLPDTVNARYMEEMLHRHGMVLFFNSEELGMLALKCVGYNLNVYEEFTNYRVSTLTGLTWERSLEDAVVIYNNPKRFPTVNTLELYAQKLYECDTTIRTNVKAMKTPVIVSGTKQQQLSLNQLYAQYDGNVPFIFGDKSISQDPLSVVDTKAPFVADKLTILKHDIWSEVLTYLGIKTSNTDKKERLVADEVQANAEFSDHNVLVMLKERQQACERINQLFGLNVGVKLRDLPEKLKGDETQDETQDESEEGQDNG